jgi:hypothetical protein
MNKTHFVSIRFTERAMKVLKNEAQRAKRTVADLLRVLAEEKYPSMTDVERKK